VGELAGTPVMSFLDRKIRKIRKDEDLCLFLIFLIFLFKSP
jgi:hypothetical protein